MNVSSAVAAEIKRNKTKSRNRQSQKSNRWEQRQSQTEVQQMQGFYDLRDLARGMRKREGRGQCGGEDVKRKREKKIGSLLNVRVRVLPDFPSVFWKMTKGRKPDGPPFPYPSHPAPNPMKSTGECYSCCPSTPPLWSQLRFPLAQGRQYCQQLTTSALDYCSQLPTRLSALGYPCHPQSFLHLEVIPKINTELIISIHCLQEKNPHSLFQLIKLFPVFSIPTSPASFLALGWEAAGTMQQS